MLLPLQLNHRDPNWSTICQVHRAFLSHAFFHTRQLSHSTLVPTEKGETTVLPDHGENSKHNNWSKSYYLTSHSKAHENCHFPMHTQGLQPTQSIHPPKIVFQQELIQINMISVIRYHSWTIGYHSYSLSLHGETEFFHSFSSEGMQETV